MSRFSDALAIDGGAGNMVAIANALVRACKGAEDETHSTEKVWEDPAVRLIVNQIVFLTKVGTGMEFMDYSAVFNQCTDKKIEEDLRRANLLKEESV